VRTLRLRALATLTVLGLALNTITTGAQQARPAPKPAAPANTQKTVRTAFYAFTMTTQPGLLPAPERRRAGGSLALLGDGFLVVTATGDFYQLSWNNGANTLRAQKLPMTVPFNRPALLKASGAGAVTGAGPAQAAAASTAAAASGRTPGISIIADPERRCCP